MQTTTTRQLEKLIFDYTPGIVAGTHVSKFFDLNVCETNGGVAPKQRYDRLPSVGDHIHAATTFECA